MLRGNFAPAVGDVPPVNSLYKHRYQSFVEERVAVTAPPDRHSSGGLVLCGRLTSGTGGRGSSPALGLGPSGLSATPPGTEQCPPHCRGTSSEVTYTHVCCEPQRAWSVSGRGLKPHESVGALSARCLPSAHMPLALSAAQLSAPTQVSAESSGTGDLVRMDLLRELRVARWSREMCWVCWFMNRK